MAADGVSGSVSTGTDAFSATTLSEQAGIAQAFSGVVQAFSDEIQVFSDAVLTAETTSTQPEQTLAQDPALANAVSGSLTVNSEDYLCETENTDRPASDGTYGKKEYTSVAGDTLLSIATAHGQTVEDLLLANPELSEDTPLVEGTVVAILDSTRLNIAREMASTTDPARLKALINEEILYATVNSPTPDDLLPALRADLLARRPADDQSFAAIFDAVAASASELWQSQGRIHEVMDQLQALTEQGDSDGLRQALLDLFTNFAWRDPRADTIDQLRDILVAFGPQDQLFADALNEAYFDFNTGQVLDAAARIAGAYANQGPVAAAQLLAELTSASHADPLTAARILNAAMPTVAQIIAHLGYGDSHEWPGDPSGGVRYFCTDMAAKEAIFGYLSWTATNVSKSPESASGLKTMAELINAELFTYVVNSILHGDGLTLPVEMLNLSFSLQLMTSISIGISGLNQLTQEYVDAFTRSAPEAVTKTLVPPLIEPLKDLELALLRHLQSLRQDGATLRT